MKSISRKSTLKSFLLIFCLTNLNQKNLDEIDFLKSTLKIFGDEFQYLEDTNKNTNILFILIKNINIVVNNLGITNEKMIVHDFDHFVTSWINEEDLTDVYRIV